jgi:hypothetical protein
MDKKSTVCSVNNEEKVFITFSLMFHAAAVDKENILGKAYNFCFWSACKTLNMADTLVRTTEAIYEKTFPTCKSDSLFK